MKISIREKLLLTGLIIAALVYLTFTYVITPSLNEQDLLKAEQIELKAQLEVLNNANLEPDLDEAISDQYLSISDIAVNYFNNTEQEELILLSNDLFNVDDLEVSGFSYSKPTIETVLEKEFLETDITVDFEGNYTSLLNILETIWAYPKFMEVKSLSLATVQIIGELGEADIYTELDEEINVEEVIEDIINEEVLVEETPVEDGVEEVVVVEETPVEDGIEEEAIIDNSLQVIVSGSMSIKLMYVLVDKPMVDDLYTWYLDDEYIRDNSFVPYFNNNATVRYIYTGQGANLFNFDRFEEFSDIDNHKMEDEIQAFLEEGYIYMNNYTAFNPDQPITRGEFVVLLDSVYDWVGETEESVDISKFNDYDTLEALEDSFAKAIQKGVQRGYIKGYDDNTLGLNEPITYSQIELVMQRILGVDTFDWNEVAKSITETKGITSARWEDSDQGLTKAEAVYLLTYFK